jgi:hypothetical protein
MLFHRSSIDDIRSAAIPEAPKIVTESPSVDPRDTMHVVSGMEKSLSAHSDYGSMVDMHSMADYPSNQWPPRMDPSDPHLSFYQTSVPVPASTHRYEQMNIGPHKSMQRPQQQHSNAMQRTVSNRSTGTDVNRGLEQQAIPQQSTEKLVVSSAPQTKAQQQASHSQQKQEALKKVSRAMADALDGSTGEVDLEKLMIRILSGQASEEEGTDENQEDAQGARIDRVLVTEKEAKKAAQMLSSLIKESPGSAYSQPRKASQVFDVDSIRCTKCHYTVARPCDLRKHMKRHEKPYGCTYPKCHKRFGAKSDWKRHENSQHFQLEAFRCDYKNSDGKECADHFLRMEHFKTHLASAHKITEDSLVAETIKRRCIGKNCQQQFWCGFERKIIELKERRNAAWDERFDHIAHHFEKDHLSIEDWVCVEENRTKRDLLREMDRFLFDDEDDTRRAQAKKGMGQGPRPPPPPPVPQQQTQTGAMPPMPPAPSMLSNMPMTVPMQQHQQQQQQQQQQNNTRKRGASSEISGPQKQARHERPQSIHHDAQVDGKHEVLRYCVRLLSLHSNCFS